MVSPSFIFIINEQGVIFNDAVILVDHWDAVDSQVKAIDVPVFLARRREIIAGLS